jgi:heavy metal sensor kinase
MMRLSIRQRLTAWYAAALLLGLAIFAVAMWVTLRQYLIAGVDARLSQRVQGMRSALGADAEIRDRRQLERELAEFAREIPDASLVQLRDAAGAVLLPVAGQQVLSAAGRRETYTAELGGHLFRISATRLESAGSVYEAQVAISMDEILSILAAFRRLLLLLIPAVVAVSCLGGFWLSSRALRPVDEITTVARSIGVRNLSQRIAVPQTGDELQRMAQTWNDVLARLDDSVKRIRQFTSDASHELRTPLAVIRTTAELALRREREPEEYRAALRQVEEEAGHMTTLTESLLTLARADTGGLDLTPQETNLNDLIQSTARQHAAVAAAKGVKLHAVAPDPPVHATADPSGLRRILVILVENALRHTPSGGTVTLSVAASGETATLAVEDTGEGIADSALPHIFERFYRADAARSGGAGFGLGLSIAQAIAQAHGSAIHVNSRLGEGARFSLALRV